MSAGRPRSGVLSSIKTACKAKYKAAVRDAYVACEHKYDDAIMQSFLNKNPLSFGKLGTLI